MIKVKFFIHGLQKPFWEKNAAIIKMGLFQTTCSGKNETDTHPIACREDRDSSTKSRSLSKVSQKKLLLTKVIFTYLKSLKLIFLILLSAHRNLKITSSL